MQVDYRGFVIENEIYSGLYSVFYCGDDLLFESLEQAKKEIDNILSLNESEEK